MSGPRFVFESSNPETKEQSIGRFCLPESHRHFVAFSVFVSHIIFSVGVGTHGHLRRQSGRGCGIDPAIGIGRHQAATRYESGWIIAATAEKAIARKKQAMLLRRTALTFV